MASVLEELIRSIELWLKINKKQEIVINPNLDPVLLVPGIAGTMLHAVDKNDKEERVWVRIFGADRVFQDKLWSIFNPSTGKTVSLDPETRVVVPEGRHGLYAIDVLDPDLIIGRESVYYFHEMIEEMIKWGFKEGKTLFGFGYDFRQSNRLQEVLDNFSAKLESVYNSSGGKKINIISHSMGGILVKCFLSLYSDVFEKYVKNWIAIAAPFQGAPGYITSSLLNGMSFVDGWEQNFFVSKWSMHQMLIECPSMYELMANPDFSWENTPLLQVWRESCDSSGNLRVMLETYESTDVISVMTEALALNKVECNGNDIALPFNIEILKWANKTREVLACAKLPSTVNFYNIYGTSNDTPHSVCYGSEKQPVSDLAKLPWYEARYSSVNGDGSVPIESAKADGFDAIARIGVSADHRGILCEPYVFRILGHWLKAGQYDPFYNPLIDFVILPTAFDKLRESTQIPLLKDEWEIVSSDDDDNCNDNSIDKSSNKAVILNAVTVACMSTDQSDPICIGVALDASEVQTVV